MIALRQTGSFHCCMGRIMIIRKVIDHHAVCSKHRKARRGAAIMGWQAQGPRIDPVKARDVPLKRDAGMPGDHALDGPDKITKGRDLFLEHRFGAIWPNEAVDRGRPAMDHGIAPVLVQEEPNIRQIRHPIASVVVDLTRGIGIPSP